MERCYIVRSIEETLERILEEIFVEDMSFDTKEEAQAFIDRYSQDIAKLCKIIVVEVKEAS